MKTTLYKATTTFAGADAPTSLYFDTREKAEDFIAKQQNGETEAVTITSDAPLNYFDGCFWNDLVFPYFNASEALQTVSERVISIRERSGLTQRGFAAKYNIPLRTVQNWEYGKADAPEYLLDLIEADINRPRLHLHISYKVGTELDQIVNYIHVEDGKLIYSKDKNPSPVFVEPVRVPLENIESFEVNLL